jgi:hypothetical protein
MGLGELSEGIGVAGARLREEIGCHARRISGWCRGFTSS